MSKAKPRPYLRAARPLHLPGEQPAFRLVKIDESGRRRQATVRLVSSTSLDLAIRAFLTPPFLQSCN